MKVQENFRIRDAWTGCAIPAFTARFQQGGLLNMARSPRHQPASSLREGKFFAKNQVKFSVFK